jgi:hypothetical protein
VRGRLIGATARSILVHQGGEDASFALTDLRRVLILTESHPSEGVIPGIALGLYAGNGLLLWSPGQPGFYVRHVIARSLASVWLLAGEAFFTAMGAGMGWLASSGGGRYAFEFSADPGDAAGARERFFRFLAGATSPSRVHFFVQTGFLLPGSSKRFGDLMAEAGYVGSPFSSASKFSVLRGLELSFSVRPKLRAGLRMSFPSEPAFAWYSVPPIEGAYSSATQDFKATAIHGVGAFTWSAGSRPRGLSVSAGLGAGVAAVRLSRRAYKFVPDGAGGGTAIDGNAVVRKTLPSAVVFGSLDLPLTAVLSIGLIADLSLIPAVTVPALPDNGLGGQKAGLSNGSVGILLGYHF